MTEVLKMKADKIKPTIVLGAICTIVAILLSSVNLITGPIIEERRNNSANEALIVVLPEGKGFEKLDISALGLPESITDVYKETSGKGYVFRATANGYKPGMIVMCGIDAEGKITGSKCLETQDTYNKEPQLDNSYNGQSISNFTPNMLSGATMTSSGYRDAVNAALQAFVLVTGGKLDPSIELEGMIPTVAPHLVNPTVVEASGNIKKALKAANDSGFAYVISSGEESYLAIVNPMGACKVYDVEGTDVTASHEDIVAEAKTHAAANQKDYFDAFQKKLERMMKGATEIEAISVDTFNTVVSAVSFKLDGAVYYGFYSRSNGYKMMDVYVVIDEAGAIAKIDAKSLFFDEDYFHVDDEVDASAYKDSFTGLTGDTFAGENAMISGATMTSDAMKQSTKDAFEAFESIQKGEEQ